jgi:hypothetical protein
MDDSTFIVTTVAVAFISYSFAVFVRKQRPLAPVFRERLILKPYSV